MDKVLLGRPLQHALIALWVVGLLQLFTALGSSSPTMDWAVSAALATLVALLIAERLRQVVLLPVAAVLGAVAMLGAAYALGFAHPLVLVTILSATALGIWQLSAFLAPLRVLQRVLGALQPSADGAWPRADLAESLIHRTCLGLSVLAFGFSAIASFELDAGVIHLPVLGLSLIFMWLTAARYRQAWQAHAVIALCAMGAAALYLLAPYSLPTDSMPVRETVSPGVVASLLDVGVALVLSVFAVCAWLAAWLLRVERKGPAPSSPGLAAFYVQPLEHGAIVIALLVIAQLALIVFMGSYDAPGWTIAVTLPVAAFTLLAANHDARRPAITSIGVPVALLGACWIESAALHGATPLVLWPSGPATVGQWIALAGLSVAAAWLAARVRASDAWRPYANSLQDSAMAMGLWAFAGATVLLVRQELWTACVFALLMLGALAPMHRIQYSDVVRSMCIVIFATFVWAALVGTPTIERLAWPLAVIWGFALWAIAHGALGHFTRRWPRSAMAPGGFVWLGLLFVVGGVAIGLIRAATDLDVAACLLSVAAYAFLMTRDSAWRGFEILSATLLVLAGWAASVVRHLTGALADDLTSMGALAFETMVWGNGVLLAVWVWNNYRERFCERFAWRAPALRDPVLSWVFGLCTLWIVACGGLEAVRWLDASPLRSASQVPVWLAMLFAVTMVHVHAHARHELVAHGVLLSLLLVANALWSSILLTGLAVLIACCCIPLAYFLAPQRARGRLAQLQFSELLRAAAVLWLPGLAAISVLASMLAPGSSDLDRTLTVAIVTAVAAWHGFQHSDRRWLYGCAAALVLLAHIVWQVWVPGASYVAQLPWLIAELALMAWLAERWARTRRSAFADHVCDALDDVWPWIAGLALVEWVVHLGAVVLELKSLGTVTIVGGSIAGGAPGHAAAVAGCLALAWLCVWQVRRTGVDAWMYLAVALAASAVVYVRLVVFGLSPLGATDTAAIMVSSYWLYALQRLSGSRALRHLTLLVPLFAIATVPFQLGSAHTALTMLAMGTLYLLAQRSTGAGTPLYLG
ncbi:MAG: hypothetical protein ACR2RL_02275, partial [Gammaproteobacteria bacterium]